MEHKMKETIQEIYFNALKKVPENLKSGRLMRDYKLAVIECISRQFPNLSINYLSKILENDVSDSTIGRFKRKNSKNHKRIWDLIENTDFCTTLDFDTFVSYRFEDFSPNTIVKRKSYYDYYKKLYVKGMLSEELINKVKKFKVLKNDYERERKRKKINEKKNKHNSLLATFTNKNKKLKKVHILATSKSSEKIKELAKAFNCEITEIANELEEQK
jgi:hypothetical protein